MVRDKLIEFVRETARHITSTADVSPELQQLRYCLCSVARQCGIQLGEALPQAFPLQVIGCLHGMGVCSSAPWLQSATNGDNIFHLHTRNSKTDLNGMNGSIASSLISDC